MLEPMHYGIFLCCLSGVAYTSWKLGVEQGVQHTLAHLEEEGIITFEEEE